MQAAPHNAKRASIPSLVVGIIKDAISLVSNEVTAARLEVYDELEKVKSAVLLISLGAGALMVGSIFLGHMLVHLLLGLSGGLSYQSRINEEPGRVLSDRPGGGGQKDCGETEYAFQFHSPVRISL